MQQHAPRRTPLHRQCKVVVVTVIAALGIAACSEKSGVNAKNDPTTTLVPASIDCNKAATIVSCAPKGSTLEAVLPKVALTATGTPIVVGTINQDTGATGAFPELTTADKVAVDFINTELGGVDGHPIDLVACNTQFNPDLSQSCAQQMVTKHAVAVIGGIDIWGTGIKTLTDNGIPLVGGIPVSFDSVRSPVSFQFSGGTWGAALGMSEYAIDTLHAKRIAMIYANFGPITDGAKLAERAIKQHGGVASLVAVPPINADMVQALNQAAGTKPDVVIALTADSGCLPVFQTAKQIGLKVPIMLTGACAATKIIDSAGDAADGKIFNLEADLEAGKADSVLYRAISEKYGPKYHYESQGAGTVSFRAVMNLYVMMRRVGATNLTTTTLVKAFKAAHNEPSFMGHPYTCDGKQLPGYPAMCAPQQTLGQLTNKAIKQLGGWIDIAAWLK